MTINFNNSGTDVVLVDLKSYENTEGVKQTGSIFQHQNNDEKTIDERKCPEYNKLLNLINKNNISENDITSIIGYKINLNELKNNSSSCKMVLRSFELRENLKERFGSNIKEYINIDNIYSLSSDLIAKIYKIIDENKGTNIENLKYSIRALCYCEQYRIDKNDIKDITPEHFVKGVEGALEDAEKSNMDSKQLAKRAIDYATALEYDWDSIEDFRKFNAGKQKEDFKTRLKRLNIIKKGNNIKQTDLKNGTIAYLNNLKKFIKAQIDKRIQENPDSDIDTLKEWGNKLYRQTVGKLLINTPDNDKKTIKNAIEAVDSNNLIQNTITGEITAHRIDKSYKTEINNEYIEDLSGTAMGEKIKNAQNTEIAAKLMNKFLDQINNLEIEVQKDKYKELLDSISNGIQKLYNNNILGIKQKKEKDKNDNDKKLLQQYDNLIAALEEAQKKAAEEEDAAQAGAKIAAGNENDAKLEKTGDDNNTKLDDKVSTPLGQALQASMKSELQENNEGAYIDVNRRIGEDIKKSDMPEEKKHQIIKFIDKISNGNFSIIMNNTDGQPKLNPPIKTDNKADGIGIKQQEKVDIKATTEVIKDIKQTIAEQTKIANGEQDNTFEVIQDTRTEVKARPEATSTFSGEEVDSPAPSISLILKDIPSIDVSEIREFSISLEPLMKQFSVLKTSVQNHIKTKLKSRSEDEKVRSIDQMDKNSDKIDLAMELKISSDKLEKLHLDTNARKNLELQEDVA